MASPGARPTAARTTRSGSKSRLTLSPAVAVLEAKSEDKPATYGLDQAKTYRRTAKRLNVPFVIATNGPWASKTPIHL